MTLRLGLPPPQPAPPCSQSTPPPPSTQVRAKLAAWFGNKIEGRLRGPVGSIITHALQEGPPPGTVAANLSSTCCQETFPIEDTLGTQRSLRFRGRHPTHLPERQRSPETKDARAHTHRDQHAPSQKQIPTLGAISSQTASLRCLEIDFEMIQEGQ